MPDARWFISRGAGSATGVRVFCFPHAGGNSRAFLDWQPLLGNDAELVAVCMPGRGHRIDEPAPASMAELVDGAAEAISARSDRPFLLFGHSLGALVAFEVARRLDGVPTFGHLVASGCSAPSLLPSQRVIRAARLKGQAFAEAVGFFGGLPPEVVADEDLRELLLPGLQADFRLVAGYRYQAGAPLAVGLSLINGWDDPHIGEDTLRPWRREVQNEPDYQWVDGGHFYFSPRPHAIVDLLRTRARHSVDMAAAAEHVELI